MNVRVREGAALPADAAAIEATLLQRRQDAGRAAAPTAGGAGAAVDASPAGRLPTTDVLRCPNWRDAVAAGARGAGRRPARGPSTSSSRAPASGWRGSRRSRRRRIGRACRRSRASAYGRPGLNFISDQFEPYGLAGVQRAVEGLDLGHGRPRARGARASAADRRRRRGRVRERPRPRRPKRISPRSIG